MALLRGINVGTAKRVSMAELRAVFESLDFTRVRTVLQSGNVVFDAETVHSEVDAAARGRIEDAIAAATGVRATLIVVSAACFRSILASNPFATTDDPSRMLISFCDGDPSAMPPRPSDEELAPERFAVGERALYQWLPDGVLASKLPARYTERWGVPCTARNLRTCGRIEQLLNT